jgi:hypothetical protein
MKTNEKFKSNLQNPKISYCVTTPKRFSVLPDFTIGTLPTIPVLAK